MLGTLLQRWLANVRVIREAPETFIVFALLIAGMMFLAIRWIDGSERATLRATIQYQDEQLTAYRNGTGSNSPGQAATRMADLQKQIAALEKRSGQLTSLTWAQLPRPCLPNQIRNCSDCCSVEDGCTGSAQAVGNGTGALVICRGAVWHLAP